MMKLQNEPYITQQLFWPHTGQHILAQFDDQAVVVYQAYKPAIGEFAAKHGYFGGDFKLSRMSWIKTNFLWMMYRSGWGTKPDQEVTLAIWLQRAAFDSILAQAVHSHFVQGVYPSEQAWKETVANSAVRLQWDPDHHPAGIGLERRAIQLGLRGSVLARYAREWIVRIEDVSDFVREQHQHVQQRRYNQLLTPRERVYPVENQEVIRQLQLSSIRS